MANVTIIDKVFGNNNGELSDVSIYIESGYKWGKGWTVDATSFEEEVKELFTNLGYSIEKRKYDFSCEYAVSDSGERLYLHPLAFEGVLLTKNITKIIEAIEKSSCMSFQTMNIKKAYNITQEEMIKAMRDNKEIIKDYILECYTEAKTDYILWDKIYDVFNLSYKNHRNSGAKMSDSIIYLTIEEFFNELLAEGKLKQLEDKRYIKV